MCDSFIAQNFRAFKEIKVPKLSKVNLILGKNSAGKTALLEALYIYLHENKISAIYELLTNKEEHLSDKEDLGSVIRHLFYGHSLTEPDKDGITLGILKSGGTVNRSKSVTIKTDIDKDFDEILIISNGNKKRSYSYLLFRDFKDSYRSAKTFRYDSKNKENLRFVYSGGVDSETVAEMWDNIASEDKEEDVIKALQIIEPELTRVIFIKDKYRYSGRRVAMVKTAGKERVPFKSMGDGINRILHIILSMVNAQNGYLLIDEFENGLHYSVQEKIWGLIFKLSETLNVQVFATTHSSDCINAFGSQWQNNEKNATLHRIDYDNEKHSVETYIYEDLDDAIQTSTEVR